MQGAAEKQQQAALLAGGPLYGPPPQFGKALDGGGRITSEETNNAYVNPHRSDGAAGAVGSEFDWGSDDLIESLNYQNPEPRRRRRTRMMRMSGVFLGFW